MPLLDLINNFAKSAGYVGTPMRFTADSLNTGFLAMASQLDMCGIEKTAAKMGVVRGDGDPVQVRVPFDVLGSNNIAPIDVAAAYATIANNGVYCTPKVIGRYEKGIQRKRRKNVFWMHYYQNLVIAGQTRIINLQLTTTRPGKFSARNCVKASLMTKR